MGDLLQQVVSFDGLVELLPIARQSLLAGVLLGVIAGVVGPMIHARDLAFAVHGTSELSFAGAACALFLGYNVVGGGLIGSLLAASVFGAMGVRAKERNSVIGIILPFGLGLGVLFLALYRGRSSNKFGLLAGQIVAVDNSQLLALTAVAVVVLAILLPIWRPLFFASVDEQVAVARGVPVRTLVVRVHARARSGGGDDRAAGRCPAGDGDADHADRRGRPGDGAAGDADPAVGGVRRVRHDRRDRAVACAGAADQPLRHHHLVPRVPRLPMDRLGA